MPTVTRRAPHLATWFLGLLILVLAAGPVLAQGAWRTHRDAKFGYSVDFPGVPSVAQETTDSGAVMDITSIEAGTTGAFLVIVTVTDARVPPARALDNATTAAVAAVDGQLVSATDLTVGGQPARDLVIRSEAQNGMIRSRMVFKGPVFYQVMAVGPLDAPLPSADRFVGSFRFLEAEAAPADKAASPDARARAPAEKAPAAKASNPAAAD
jgi:hypothetical protein